jgi:hypothetical protein
MASWRTALILWLVAGLSSAFLVPFMTDQLLLAVYAIGAVVGVVLAVASVVRRSERLARWGAVVGAVWAVVYAAVVLANVSAGPIEYLVLPVIAAIAGAAAGWVSYVLARGTTASPSPDLTGSGV